MHRFRHFLLCVLVLSGGLAIAKERVWDQEAARKKMEAVLKVEAARRQPWNAIPWHTDPKTAIAEAKRKRRPLLVFMFSEADGPPLERCCLAGRLVRGLSLSDEEVQRKITSSFVPLKLIYTEEKGFPVQWAVLKGWETKFQFAASDGCAGVSVFNADLTMEFANSGSALIGELFDSVAYNPRKFSRMLSRGYQRWKEDGLVGRGGGLSVRERKQEVARYRRGVTYEVEKEGEIRLPPKGYSLEKAVALEKMCGVGE